MLLNIILFILGFVFLIGGSEFFVKAAASIAKRLGVSEFVIGLTVVALGTSIPELASSIVASLKHESGVVIGNIVGSNIANIGLIIGITAVFMMIKTKEGMLKRDGYIMLFAALLFFVFILNGILSRLEAVILLLFYFAYLFFLFEVKHDDKTKTHFRDFIDYFFKFKYLTTIKSKIISGLDNKKDVSNKEKKEIKELFKAGLIKDFLILAISLVFVIYGAKYVVDEAVFFAGLFNISTNLISITLIAVGTSLPELMVSISATRRGHGDITLGNIIGSNITNIFLIIGVSGLIYPLSIIKTTLYFTAPFMIFISILLLFFVWRNWEIRRIEGIILLVLYLIFLILLFFLYF